MADSQFVGNSIVNYISLIHEISDDMAYRIITSIIDSAKAATQISMENIPLSSTYKKLKKLQRSGLVRIQKYELDETGKKVLLYRGNISSFEFKMERGRLHISQALTSS